MPVQYQILDEEKKPIEFKSSMMENPATPAEHYVACIVLFINCFEQKGPVWEKIKPPVNTDSSDMKMIATTHFVHQLHSYPHPLFDHTKMIAQNNPNKEFYAKLAAILKENKAAEVTSKLIPLLETFKVPGISKILISIPLSDNLPKIFTPEMTRAEAMRLNKDATALLSEEKKPEAATPLFLKILLFYVREYKRNNTLETGQELLSVYFNLGTAFLKSEKLPQAKQYLQKAVDCSNELNSKYGHAINSEYSDRLAECDHLIQTTESLNVKK